MRKERRKRGRKGKTRERGRGKRKEGGREERRQRDGGKENGRKGERKEARLGGEGEENLVIGIISAQTYFYLLEIEPKSQPGCLLCPVHILAMLLCFRCPVMLLGSDQWEPVLENLFPQGMSAFCRCLLTYQQLERCLTQFLNH